MVLPSRIESSGSSSGRGGLRGVGRRGYGGGEGHIEQARQQDRLVKSKQEMYKDTKATVKPHNIKEGDSILLQRKSTKSKSPHDPQPFTVEEVHGTRVKGRRGERLTLRQMGRGGCAVREEEMKEDRGYSTLTWGR